MTSPSDRLIFLSLKPRFANAILDGAKQIELRRQPPRIETPTHALLYASTPKKAVVGECLVTEIIELAPSTLWRKFGAVSGVTHREFEEYFLGSERAFGLLLAGPSRFDEEVTLEQLRARFAGFQPPQSFRYFPDSSYEELARSANAAGV